jgi:hypothetical protein
MDKKMWYIHTLEYYAATTNNKAFMNAKIWKEFENILFQ